MPTWRASTACCTTSAPTCGRISRSATSPRSAVWGLGRVEHDAAQGQPDPVRERRGKPRAVLRSARRPRLDPGHPRLQRDLTDSSMQRNIGAAFGHAMVALDNVSRGPRRPRRRPGRDGRGPDANWEVLGEAVQSAMRALAAAGVPGMDAPTSGSGAHPWTPDHRRGPARVRPRASTARRRRSPGCLPSPRQHMSVSRPRSWLTSTGRRRRMTPPALPASGVSRTAGRTTSPARRRPARCRRRAAPTR